MMVSFVLSFFPRDVLDEILNLIESVSEGFPTYSYTKELKKLASVQVFWARLASFGQLGLMSYPKISLKLHNGINDPKAVENNIYTLMKGWENFSVTTQSQSQLVNFNLFYKRVILWKQGLHQRTEKNCRVHWVRPIRPHQ